MADDKQFKVRVDPDLHHRAKIEAAKRGVSLSDVVRDALVAFVSRRPIKPDQEVASKKRD